MADFKLLKVWQKAHALSLKVDRAASGMRSGGNAALRNQMVRAAQSMPTNIVEGCGQESAKEYARFLRIALNSSRELEYHLIVAADLEAIDKSPCLALTAQTIEIRKMLYGLIRYLRGKIDEEGDAEADAAAKSKAARRKAPKKKPPKPPL